MSRLKLAGQVGAVGLVAALLGLLVWKVVQERQDERREELREGADRRGPSTSTSSGWTATARCSSRRCAERWSWSTSGPPGACRASARRRSSRRRTSDYRGRVEFVGVDTADFTGEARQFLERYGVRYPNVRDPDTSVLDDYGGLPIPRTYVIARDWIVSGYIYGETREETLRSAIEEALAT